MIATKIAGYIPFSTIAGHWVKPQLREPRAALIDSQLVCATAEARLRRLGLDTSDLYQSHSKRVAAHNQSSCALWRPSSDRVSSLPPPCPPSWPTTRRGGGHRRTAPICLACQVPYAQV